MKDTSTYLLLIAATGYVYARDLDGNITALPATIGRSGYFVSATLPNGAKRRWDIRKLLSRANSPYPIIEVRLGYDRLDVLLTKEEMADFAAEQSPQLDRIRRTIRDSRIEYERLKETQNG